jgi:hypothetical protein
MSSVDKLGGGSKIEHTVVGGILLAGNECLGMEEVAVGPISDLVDYTGLQVDVKRAWHVLAIAGL